MTTLHIVTGLYSCVNSFSSGYVDPRDDNHVLVLFSAPEDEKDLRKKVSRLPGVRSVSFLSNPREYISTLSDPEKMARFCGGATPSSLRIFFSHSHWLLNAAASAFPDASVTLFEEGMAGLYPDNLAQLQFLDRIARVDYHDYLGVVRPLAYLQRPELFEPIDPHRFITTLAKACGTPAAPVFDATTVVLVEQYFDRKGDSVSTGELVELYLQTTRRIVEAGYVVAYKPHPRHASTIYDHLIALLPEDLRDRVALVEDGGQPLEFLMAAARPAAVVAVNSTILLTAPHLLGIPSFRIDCDYGLRLAESLPAERLGQLSNYLLLRDRIPDVRELPVESRVDGVWAVFEQRITSWPVATEDPMLRALAAAGPDSTADLVAQFRKVASHEGTVVSFDLFDTLVARPAIHPNDVFYLADRQSAVNLAPMARFSNARGMAVSYIRGRDRLAGTERAEYSIHEISGATTQLLGLPKDDIPRVQGTEFVLEQELLRARSIGFALYAFATRLGKRVGIISDTFYSASQIVELVGPLLAAEPEFVITSADFNATKAGGGLFGFALAELQTTPADVLHIGDNPVSDGEVPSKRGISTTVIPSSVAAALNTRLFRDVWRGYREERGSAIVRGVIANRLFDNPYKQWKPQSLALGSPFVLGYAVAGPAVLGFTLWLTEELQKSGNDRVAFLSRDGFLPFALYRRLRALDQSLPRPQYLIASRRIAFQVFSGEAAHVAMTRFVHGLNPRNSLRTVMETRFGRESLAYMREDLQRSGFIDWDTPLGKDGVSTLSLLLSDSAEKIAVASTPRSQAAREYYRRELGDAESPTVVDLGYSGSSQRAIMTSLERDVDGLYFTTMEHAVEYSKITGAPFIPWSQDRTFFQNGSVLEYLLSPAGLPESIEIGMHDQQPVFSRHSIIDPINSAIQSGISEFVDDVLAALGSRVFDLGLRAETATRVLAEFIQRPAQGDVEMLSLSTQDDAVGSGSRTLLDQWPDGRRVLSSSKKVSS